MKKEKIIRKAYKFRIYPNKEQRGLFEAWFGQTRFVYNHFLALRSNQYKVKKWTKLSNDMELLSIVGQHHKVANNKINMNNLLPDLKVEFPWLKEIPSQSLQQKVGDLDSGFQKFFTGLGGYPRFKKKGRNRDSFKIPQGFCLAENYVSVPKISGAMKICSKRELGRLLGTPKNITISKNPDQKYYISIQCELSQEEIYDSFHYGKKSKILKNRKKIGIDIGIKTMAVGSNGEEFSPAKATNRYAKKLAKAQKNLSRKASKSKNRAKARLKVAKIHSKITKVRQDSIHQMTTKVVRENQTIMIENLNVLGMLKNRKLSKAIADAAFGEIRRQFKYKSLWYEKDCKEVDRFFASSKICHVCKFINQDLKLSQREWTCKNCNSHHGRDENASKNLRDWKPAQTFNRGTNKPLEPISA